MSGTATTPAVSPAAVSTKDARAAAWAVSLGAAGLVFDGYDLVVYGALVPLFLRSPGELGPLDAATAGALGSYALLGMLVGALLAGAAADRWGRRIVLLTGYAWFSVGMAVTALSGSVATFGFWRFATGIGIGIVVGTTGALVSELAPPGRRQLFTTISYCGIPVGSVLGTLAALVLLDGIGWRGLFWLGALPLVTLLPLAVLRLPESPAFTRRATAVASTVVAPTVVGPPAAGSTVESGRAGFAGMFTGAARLPTLLLGLISAIGLLMVFALGTWLPELMGRAGYGSAGGLLLLLVLNGGAVLGALSAAPLAERLGPRRVVAGCFTLGALGLAMLALAPPGAVTVALVAVAGIGTTGTQILVIGLATATFPVRMRGAGVAWCTGFGRIGGLAGPLLVGVLVAAQVGLSVVFAGLAVLAVVGGVLAMGVRAVES